METSPGEPRRRLLLHLGAHGARPSRSAARRGPRGARGYGADGAELNAQRLGAPDHMPKTF